MYFCMGVMLDCHDTNISRNIGNVLEKGVEGNTVRYMEQNEAGKDHIINSFIMGSAPHT